jgi:SAM-dependent methyltransferase
MKSNLRKKLYKIKLKINEELIDKSSGEVKSELLEKSFCASCLSTSFTKQRLQDGFHFVKCNNCGLVYVNPRLKEPISDSFYVASDLMSTLVELQQEEKEEEAEVKFIPILERMKQFQVNRNSWLDIGCSVGNLMSLAQEYGWNIEGVELNKDAHKVCLSKGLKVYNQKIETLNLPSKYSVISLFALIEHLHNPDSMIASIKNNLAKDGLIVLFFPDWDWDWEHPQVNGRAHLWYFNESTIGVFLKRHGIKIQDTWAIDWLKGPKRIVVASLDK